MRNRFRGKIIVGIFIYGIIIDWDILKISLREVDLLDWSSGTDSGWDNPSRKLAALANSRRQSRQKAWTAQNSGDIWK